jgi:hypothetical protein
MNISIFGSCFPRVLALAVISLLGTSVAHASLVTWELNPSLSSGAVGSTTEDYTASGYMITARGYDNNGGTGIGHQLFFKNAGGDEIGLGLVNTANNELQVNSSGSPLQFIQLDVRSILSQGFTNGKIEVGSVQSGELFNLYGSNLLGNLGAKLNPTAYDSSKDGIFVSVPNFGAYQFISVVAAAADVLPVAFEANIAPVPEAETVIPVLFLISAVAAFEVRRRRRSKVS